MRIEVSSFIKELSHRIPSLCPINVSVTRTTNRNGWQPNPSSSKTVLSPCPRFLLYCNDDDSENTVLTCLEHFNIEFVVMLVIFLTSTLIYYPDCTKATKSNFHCLCSFLYKTIYFFFDTVLSKQYVLNFYNFNFIQGRAIHMRISPFIKIFLINQLQVGRCNWNFYQRCG